MDNSIKHIGNLIGRVFLITHPASLKEWRGDKGDYDLLDDFISYEEGDLAVFRKSLNMVYYIFFSMSSKIEIFRKSNGFIICDGLYFNKSWDYSNQNSFEVVEEMDISFEVQNESTPIFDASFDGNDILINDKDGIYNIKNNSLYSYAIIKLDKGVYTAKRVQTKISINDENVLLKGIEISS